MMRWQARTLGQLDGAVLLNSSSALDRIAAMLTRIWRVILG
jgi:hypothetical protein